ncbi:MAG: M23 family metallopeptidase [Candidatus Margulisbacteria bacterium]|nr:M23 family metallopeptidase [Candidatus Margulisiibacteriota bacterium]
MKNFINRLLLLLSILSFSFPAEVFFSNVIKQGDSNSILLRAQTKLNNPELNYNNKTIPMHLIYYGPEKYVYRCVIGTDPLTSVGVKKVKIILQDQTLLALSFTVTKNNFQEEYIAIPEAKKGALTNKNLVNEGNIIGSKFKEITKQAKWRDRFIMPAEGRISSPYGAQRKYNVNNIAWWHKGVDIANSIGTPVLTPNDGTIILTGSYAVHGKTIMIDHGQGIVSVFNHLNSIDVNEGDFVKKGKKVATMGNTGNSTGPHLHWGLSVNNVRVNPLQWVNNRFAPNYF